MPTPLRRSGSGLLQESDYCLRLTAPGSARSAPHGILLRRGRVLFPYGLQLCSTSLRLRLSAVTGDFTTGLLWRLARAGLSPAGRPALAGRYCRSRNGSSTRPGMIFPRTLAVLGIRIDHSKVGHASSWGKIERFFGTVRSQFLIELTPSGHLLVRCGTGARSWRAAGLATAGLAASTSPSLPLLHRAGDAQPLDWQLRRVYSARPCCWHSSMPSFAC
jgi:transposase InsO family protein